jgi:2-polyprenyl-6-methoxyphenol hydroxylase-like FAD-dependent oxidoreductase
VRIIVCGAGISGLALAMMLAADGHDTTVLEADPAPTPDPADAWDGWRRRGVAQFHQPHVLLTRFRRTCDQELPGLVDQLRAAGCVESDYLEPRPPGLAGDPSRPGDAELRLITGRRPVVEAAVASAALATPGVTVRRGVRVAALLRGTPARVGVPHVTGVRTADGERMPADLVVDATGRRTRSGAWLAELGARPPTVTARDRGFVYYTRFFAGTRPQRLIRAQTPIGSISLLTLDGDRTPDGCDTWSVTVYGTTGDAPLRALRDPAAFTRVVAACPRHAHWLDGTPLTGVVAMAGGLDRHLALVHDGTPVVTGFAAVGDAWAVTNPSAGRGLSLAVAHAAVLRRVARDHLDRPDAFARELAAATEHELMPFHRAQAATDDVRLAEIDAARSGRVLGERPIGTAPPGVRLATAAACDGDALRGLLETVLCLATPEQVLARPAVAAALAALPPGATPPPVPGPDRQRLLALLAG